MRQSTPLVLILVPLAVLQAATAAHAASFDCAKAATPVEKLVCSNPALSRTDEELAKAYRSALASSGDKTRLRDEQRLWIRATRDRCPDVSCLSNAYAARIAELTASGSTETRTGSYRSDNGTLDVIADRRGGARFAVSATWTGANPGQVHTGETCGTLAIDPAGVGVFRDAELDCMLRFVFRADAATISQEGTCGFGLNVSAEGQYRKRSAAAPKLEACAGQ
jgi:uncharacterized protein